MRARFDFTRKLPGFLTLSIAFTACHGSGGSVAGGVGVVPAAAAVADLCILGPTSGPYPKTLRFLVTDGIAPGEPGDAGTRGERIIARWLYETLIRVTCDGRVLPGLAESWSSGNGGRIWTFKLREAARFWDGTPVMAAQVLASWAGGRTTDAQLQWAGIEHARIADDRQVAVYFAEPRREVPAVLSDPRLSVTLGARGQSRPQGSGPYRPIIEDSVSLVVDAWDSGIPRRKDMPSTLEFHAAAGRAARDQVDAGVDLLITDDRSLLEYATARGQHTILPMPWDRTYGLFVPATPATVAPAQGPDAAFLDPIAREAVGVDARVAERSGAWQPDSCGANLGLAPDVRQQPPRVVYSSADETARELAHRLVTFAGVRGQGGEWLATAFRMPSGPSQRSFPLAIGLETSAWPGALVRGNEVAYVFALPMRRLGGCTPPARSQGWWIGLIDTRPHLAIRTGLGGVSLDWDGTPFLKEPR